MFKIIMFFLGILPTYTLIPNTLSNLNTLSNNIIKISNHHNICPDNLYQIKKYIGTEISQEIITTISGTLPKIDSIGGHILHTHDIVINYILNLETIPIDLKKTIVLTLIQLVQNGDNAGSFLLQFYYDLVNCLL